MLTVTKTIISTVLLSILLAKANTVEARLKYYRYNDNIPMVEMSLNMMVAMGVLEQIPSRLVHDGNPYNRMVTAKYNPRSRSHYGYPARAGYYTNKRYTDYWDDLDSPYDRYYGNRFDYTPYRDRYRSWEDPWYSRWGNQWNDPWSTGWSDSWISPWGGLRGNRLNNPWGGYMSNPWGGYVNNPWGGYVNNPWGNAWSSQWMNPWSNPLNTMNTPYSGLNSWPYTSGYPNIPMSPNTVFESAPGLDSQPYSDPSSINQQPGQDGYTLNPTAWSANTTRLDYARDRSRSRYSSSPETRLNGLWIGDNGEMLGIRGDKFIWYDGNNRYANGILIKTPTTIEARAEGSNKIIRYHYGFLGDELVTMSRKGKIHTYSPMPLKQSAYTARPHAAYSSYRRFADDTYPANANIKSGVAAPLSAYTDDRDDATLAVSAYANRRNDAAIAYGHGSNEENALWGSLDPVIDSLNRKYVPAYSANADRHTGEHDVPAGAHFHSTAPTSAMDTNQTGVAVIWNNLSAHTAIEAQAPASLNPQTRDRPVNTAPVNAYPVNYYYLPGFKDSKPVDKKIRKPHTPYSNYGAEAGMSSVNPPDEGAGTANSESAEAGSLDPNTYLYSYMKDNNASPAHAAPYPRDNSNIWAPSASYRDDAYKAAAPTFTAKNGGTNISKPGNTFADSRRNTQSGLTYYSGANSSYSTTDQPPGSAVRRFDWSPASPWN
jgi:hypothetical protein